MAEPSVRAGDKIDHVVVLMMENHSFDHLLGYHPSVGTLLEAPRSLPDPTRPTEPLQIQTWQWNQFSISPCPAHDHRDVMRQLYGAADPWESSGQWAAPSMDGFLLDYLPEHGADPRLLMGCFAPQQLPALSLLAKTFTVCSRWFCSVPGPTGPNRLFANCASSGGYAGTDYTAPSLSRLGISCIPSTFLRIEETRGLTWKVYHECPEFYSEGGLAVVQANRSANVVDPFFNEFCCDARHGRLPSYSFLTPSLPHSQHDSWDARTGDHLIALVYNTLLGSDAWERTLLVITYDEHGGHYDHVPPPREYLNTRTGKVVRVENPDGAMWNTARWGAQANPEFDFTLLGPRVPALVISAHTPAAVDDTVYEHASIPATLNELWGFAPLTRRDAVANSLLRNVTATPRPRDSLPFAPIVAIPKR
jgi:phospholipase C